MVNIRKNKKKKGVSKSNIGQKENLPKRKKVNKSPVNDSIALSKQLMTRQKIVQRNNSNRLNRNTTNRVCSNGKPMPSLKDLEKMYEDSDEDSNALPVRAVSPKIITIIDLESLNSPVQVNMNTTTSDAGVTTGEHMHSSIIELDTPTDNTEEIKNTKLLESIEENIDDNSSDSNKTIDYNLSTHSTFCPMPSTSKDNNIINKNDQLFYESLKKLPLSSNKKGTEKRTESNSNVIISNVTNDNKNDSDSDDDCFIIENETDAKIQNNIATDSTKQITYNTSSSRQTNYNTDTSKQTNCDTYSTQQNNCFTDSTKRVKCESTDLTRKTLNDTNTIATMSIDIEHIDIDSVTNNIESVVNLDIDKGIEIQDEIIDIDTLIADNLTKQNNFNKIDTSIVDVSITHESSNIPIEQRQIQSAPTLISESTQTESQASDQQDVVFVSETENLQSNSEPSSNYETNDDISFSVPPAINSDSTLINNQRQYSRADVEYRFLHEVSIVEESTPHIRDMPNICHSVRNALINSFFNHRPPRSRTEPGCSPRLTMIVKTTRKNKHKKKKQSKDEASETTLPATNVSTETTRDVGDCPICMETFIGKAIASTICGHVFCMECLDRSMRTNNRCPKCRKILKKKGSYHQIFL